MKKTHLEKKLRDMANTHDASIITRQGRHEVWIINGLSIPIPRHREINEITARTILKKAEAHLKGDTQ